jgi:two-component sensor histidine kinase
MLASMEHRAVPVTSEGAWLLLEELNHRIRNELQVALSALRLARRGLASADPARLIEEAVLRLEAFGSVHQLLDRQRGQGPLAPRLEGLCRAVSLAKAAPLGIRLVLNLDDVTTDEESSWTVCVVAFELMTNAFKHAFAGGLTGVVSVVLKQERGAVVLRVTDDGVGSAAQAQSAETVWRAPGFGCRIVTQLAERLGGSVTRVSGPYGTTVTFVVPGAQRPH